MNKKVTAAPCEACGGLLPLLPIQPRRRKQDGPGRGKDAHHPEQGSTKECEELEERQDPFSDSETDESSGKMRSYDSVLGEIQAIFANQKVKRETISPYIHRAHRQRVRRSRKPTRHERSLAHQHAISEPASDSERRWPSRSYSPADNYLPCFLHPYHSNVPPCNKSITVQSHDPHCKRSTARRTSPIEQPSIADPHHESHCTRSIAGEDTQPTCKRDVGRLPPNEASTCSFDPLRISPSPRIQAAHVSSRYLHEQHARRSSSPNPRSRHGSPQTAACRSALESRAERNTRPRMESHCTHDVLKCHIHHQHVIDATTITSPRKSPRHTCEERSQSPRRFREHSGEESYQGPRRPRGRSCEKKAQSPKRPRGRSCEEKSLSPRRSQRQSCEERSQSPRRSQRQSCEERSQSPRRPQSPRYICHQITSVQQHHVGCHLHSASPARDLCPNCGCPEREDEEASRPERPHSPKADSKDEQEVIACAQRLSSPRCKMHGECRKPKPDVCQQRERSPCPRRAENTKECPLHGLPSPKRQEPAAIPTCSDPPVAPKRIRKPKPCPPAHWLDRLVASQKFPCHIIQQFLQGKRKCPPRVKKPKCPACLAKCLKAPSQDPCESWKSAADSTVDGKKPRCKLSRLALSRNLIIKPVVKLSTSQGPSTRKEFQVCSECRNPLATKKGRWKSILEEMAPEVPKKCNSTRAPCQTMHGLEVPSDRAIDLRCPELFSAFRLHSRIQKLQCESFDRRAALQACGDSSL